MATIAIKKNGRKRKFHTWQQLQDLASTIPLKFETLNDNLDFLWLAFKISECRKISCRNRYKCHKAIEIQQFMNLIRQNTQDPAVEISCCLEGNVK